MLVTLIGKMGVNMWGENKELDFGHVKSEKDLCQPKEDIKQAIRNTSLELRGKGQGGNTNLKHIKDHT